MRKNKIIVPSPACFQTKINVQVGDINYGGHVGNERYLLFAQETRIRFLEKIGCSEMKFGDYGLVLAEAEVEYFHELFYGDVIEVSLSIANILRASFECYYTIHTTREVKTIIAAQLLTKMVCFDYNERKVKSISETLKQTLQDCSAGKSVV
jgi:YbgC/YbaW family acyl-CoA thioester hydrolase